MRFKQLVTRYLLLSLSYGKQLTGDEKKFRKK